MKSPNYPLNYPVDQFINYPLTVAEGKAIELTFTSMEVVLYGDVPGAPAVLQEHPHALTVALSVVFALVGNVDVDVGVGDRKVL